MTSRSDDQPISFGWQVLRAKCVREEVGQDSALVRPVVVDKEDLQVLSKLVHELSIPKNTVRE